MVVKLRPGFFLLKDSALRPLAVSNVDDKDMNKENTPSSLCSCNSKETIISTEKQKQSNDPNSAQQKEDNEGILIASLRDHQLRREQKYLLK